MKTEEKNQAEKERNVVVVDGVKYEIEIHDKPDKLFEWDDSKRRSSY